MFTPTNLINIWKAYIVTEMSGTIFPVRNLNKMEMNCNLENNRLMFQPHFSPKKRDNSREVAPFNFIYLFIYLFIC